MGGTDIHYARSGDRHVGYQVQGDGPIDVIGFTNGTTIWIDQDDEPHWSRFDRRLATFSRLIRFDPSGFGLSDPLPVGSGPSIELWMHDAIAVLDAVGCERAALFGVGVGGLAAMLLSASHPERTSSQVLMHCAARIAEAPDYACGVPQAQLDEFVNAVTDPDYEGDAIDDLAMMAPSAAGDAEFRLWWQQAGRRGASPAMARALNLLGIESDVRAVLPLIAAPTLIIHRSDNRFYEIGHSRYLAEHIAGSELIELAGEDHLPFLGATDALLGEIEEFLTGTRGPPDSDRVLTTILFADIVDSTQRVVGYGDQRWRELLDSHDRMAQRQIRRFRGQQVKTTGDGFLATFDGPASAIQCGLAVCDAARQLGLEVRIGVHTGEVERRGHDVAGIGVHIAARVEGCAHPGEVWVSRTVTDLVAGSGLRFSDRGERPLKGVPGTWQLFSVEV